MEGNAKCRLGVTENNETIFFHPSHRPTKFSRLPWGSRGPELRTPVLNMGPLVLMASDLTTLPSKENLLLKPDSCLASGLFEFNRHFSETGSWNSLWIFVCAADWVPRDLTLRHPREGRGLKKS